MQLINKRTSWFVRRITEVTLPALTVSLLFLFNSVCCVHKHTPQLYTINPDSIITKKKLTESQKSFLAEFLPRIYYENELILLERQKTENFLLKISKNKKLKNRDKEELNRILLKYRMQSIYWDLFPDTARLMARIDSLLTRVDIIPARLAMAQAIIESGWGNSRFAREGNNYFGIHCFTPGCGIKPVNAGSSSFEIKTFPSQEASIQAYFQILNTGYTYQYLRKIRAKFRAEGKNPDPYLLASGLDGYSQIGDNYERLIHKIIRDFLPDNIPRLFETAKK